MIIADECLNIVIIKTLKDNGWSVLSISEEYPGISDKEIIQLSIREQKIIITQDKGFGDLFFKEGLEPHGVILIRAMPDDIPSIAKIILNFINNNYEDVLSSFVVITPDKIRIR